MKLVGSNIEKQYRAELQRGHHALFFGTGNQRLLASITQSFPDRQTAFVLDWIPEEDEDIFTVLVDISIVAVFELLRSANGLAEAKNVRTVDEYRRNLKKQKMIKLLVALDLASKSYSRPPKL